jgi:hypothetical protein
MRTSNRFTKGIGLYRCRCCGRQTRDTGRGDNELVGNCAECYDLAGEENSLSDTGDFYETPAFVLELIAAVAAKGGDASYWDHIKVQAQAKVDGGVA